MESSRLVRTLAAVATTALTTAASAACGSDDPVAARAADVRVTATAAPTTAPTTAGSDEDRSGGRAIGTVREWVAAYNRAVESGKTAGADELASSCGTCDELLEAVDRGDGGPWRIHGIEVSGRSTDSTTVTADITTGRTRSAVRFVVDRGAPATVREMAFQVPRAAGAAASTGGSAGR